MVGLIRRIWEDQDGFIPIDQRLPSPAKAALLKALAPSAVVDSRGNRKLLDNSMLLGDDECLAMATSGTTGDPKIIVYTHDQVKASAQATSKFIGVTEADKWLCCLPVAHIGGLSVILRSLVLGNPVEVQSKFDPAEVMASTKRGVTLTSLVSTALARIDPSLFRRIILGGSKPPPDIPSNTLVTYGLTETGSGVVYNGTPLAGLEIKIGKSGEILLRGPMIATRYRSGAPITDADNWFHTRDGGRFEDGRLEVFGRLDEVINSGGEKIFPATLESLLSQHPKIAEVAIIAVPDPVWGEAVTAAIVPLDDQQRPSLSELREFTKEKLPSYYAPIRIHFVKQMPKTALGKIQKNLLKTKIHPNQHF